MILDDFERVMLEESYVAAGEVAEDVYPRVCKAAARGDTALEARLLSYFTKNWVRTSTPITSNLGTDRGLPISCYVQEYEDSKKGIFAKWYEAMVLGAAGGGLGGDYSNVRNVGALIGQTGKSAGIVPFIKVDEALASGVSQANQRRASKAVYLDSTHPEIVEFIELRKTTGASAKRRAPELHHGVKLSDAVMQKIVEGGSHDLIQPNNKAVVGSLDSFDMWSKILTTRHGFGEPYILYTDNCNRQLPQEYINAGWKVTTSQLCSEITLRTAPDYTAVCCLASVNMATMDEWLGNYQFIKDMLYVLDAVLDDFIVKAKSGTFGEVRGFEDAIRSAEYERSTALGVMGMHTYLQDHLIPFESSMAEGAQRKCMRFLKDATTRANHEIAIERGACPMSIEYGNGDKRFINVTGIAPTASISILARNVSPGIDPIIANTYIHENKTGKHPIRNQSLQRYLVKYAADSGKGGDWVEDVWQDITRNKGSVLHLDWMDDNIKDVFKTAFEIDQRWVVTHAVARQEDVDQSQSLNVFFLADVDVTYLSYIHLLAWKLGVKSLYYCRSQAVQRAATGHNAEREIIEELTTYDTCLSCQ